MKRSLFALGLLLAASLSAAEIWVAPEGDDHNPGTKEKPFASPEIAVRKARELRRLNDPSLAGGITIILRGGTYALAHPLLFRVEDSGTAESPTTIRSAENEFATLSGGVAVRGWKHASDLAGLPEASYDHVWVAAAPPGLREFWWQTGTRAVHAREPNEGKMNHLKAWDRTREEATVDTTALAGLRVTPGVEMVLEQQWEIAILRLKSLAPASAADNQTRVTFQQPESRVEFEHPWPQPVLPPAGAGAFFLTGAPEFLDAPGEWYQDPADNRVYYWPRDNEDIEQGQAVAPALETLVRVRGTPDHPVTNLRFERIGFSHTAWPRPGQAGHVPHQEGMPMIEAYKLKPSGTPDKKGLENQAWITRLEAGVIVDAAQQIRFTRCRFEHTAASALDFVSAVRDCTVEGCTFRDIGGNGLQLGSYQEGSLETHIPYQPTDDRVVCAKVRIANNLFADTAHTDWGCVAIGVGYAREIGIEHNEIDGTSYTGISVGWGWTRTKTVLRDNLVHANLIRHAISHLCDAAGVYTLSAQPGTVVSENVVEPVTISPYVDRPEHWFYYYTDEGSSYLTVRDNWCPAEKFLNNANGPEVTFTGNGPTVSEQIKSAAGLEPAFRDLRQP